MPLDVSQQPSKAEALTLGFGQLGLQVGKGEEFCTLPVPRSGRDKLAVEYWAASALLRLAESRKERAKRAAVGAGVLPDITVSPFPIGSAETVYSSSKVTIGVKVTPQADRVDMLGLIADLEKAGVNPRTLKRLLKKHTPPLAGAHTFTALLKE